ncbi:hypothetical protein FI667_g8119, partial [Globisporangium splendens]
MEALADAGLKSTGAKTEQQFNTAAGRFNTFLRSHGGVDVSSSAMYSIGHACVTAELMGRFGTYLFMNVKKLSAAHSYMSQVKSFFARKWQGCPEWSLHLGNASDTWYSELRSGMKKMYVNKATQDGVSMVGQAPPLYRDALRTIAPCLFLRNTPSSLQERDLLATRWHCMGRAGESDIRHSNNKFVELPTSALQFEVGRSKTGTMHNVLAFCDAQAWESDIFHTKPFRNVSASSINEILARFSRSGRSRRLTFDAVSRVFLNFSGMDRGDMRVGRVVASWPDSDHGGIPPSPATIPSKDRPLFRALVSELFKSYLNIYERAMLDVLAASFIMHYSAVIASWETTCGVGESLATSTTNAGMVCVGGETSTLIEWSKLVHEQWLLDDLPWLRGEYLNGVSKEIKDNVSIGYFSFQELLQRQVNIQHRSTQEIALLRSDLQRQSSELSGLTVKLGTIMQTQSVILQLLSAPPHFSKVPLASKPSAASTTTVFAPRSAIPIKLGGIRAVCLFMDFYSNQWHTHTPMQNEKDSLRKTRLLVKRFKNFFSPGFVICAPPPLQDRAFEQWYTKLEAEAKAAEGRIIDYLNSSSSVHRKRTFLSATSLNKELSRCSIKGGYPTGSRVDF